MRVVRHCAPSGTDRKNWVPDVAIPAVLSQKVRQREARRQLGQRRNLGLLETFPNGEELVAICIFRGHDAVEEGAEEYPRIDSRVCPSHQEIFG